MKQFRTKGLAHIAQSALAGLALAMGMLGAVNATEGYAQVKADYNASDVLLVDRSGQPLDRVRVDFQSRRGAWIALEDVSVALQRAVILSEDRRFYEHDGVDWRAIAAAAWGNLVHEQRRGASTLSMQLLGLIDHAYRRGPGGRSIVQKFDQALEARQLERQWTKPQILEAYLNLAAFRGELVGVDALSRVLFQKHPNGLNARESALAAVMLRAPNADHAVLVRRACQLLGDMGAPQECTGLRDFVSRALSRSAASWADIAEWAPHYARLALREYRSNHAGQNPGGALATTLNGRLQRYALHSMGRHLQALGGTNVRDAAIVVLDNRSGDVLAYVGSSGDLSDAGRVDHARALRQAGSTLKPFLYAQAIEQERLTTVSLLNDAPLNLPTGNGLYIPQNYDKHFAGWVSVRTALASSLNIPAVRVLLMVTPDAFAQRLVQLGIPLDQSGDFYGYSLALGSADVTLLSLTNAYRALANEGSYTPPRFLDATHAESKAMVVGTPAAAWIIGDMLSDRQARARTFGLDSALSTPFWTAVKTGTSKDMRDNWCVGWSQHYTVGVWVGNSGGASMRGVSGVSGAGPIWHDLMAFLHREQESVQSAAPSSVTQAHVVFQDQIEPAREDFFLGDTAVTQVRLAQDYVEAQDGAPQILAPAHGAILALDPDIPVRYQRAWLQATNVAAQAADDVLWRINGKMVGSGGAVAWAPMRGKQRIELLDAHSRVLDAVQIEVRGGAPG